MYRIEATGAGYFGPGGFGASVSALFFLRAGTGLEIAIGQNGVARGRGMTPGGGGGTFVILSNRTRDQDDTNVNTIPVPLLIAGNSILKMILSPVITIYYTIPFPQILICFQLLQAYINLQYYHI